MIFLRLLGTATSRHDLAHAALFKVVLCQQHAGNHVLQSFETMKGQLLDEARRARARVFVMLVQWARDGTWPKFRDRPVFFLRLILAQSATQKHFAPEKDFPESFPPWEAKHAAHFLERTALTWYSLESDPWARDFAPEAFDSQEDGFSDYHPSE